MCMQIYLVQSVCMCFWPQLSCQMVELFEACQQQSSDLARKEMCRTRLQQDIQRIYAGLTRMQYHSALAFCCNYYHLSVFLIVARLYLNGSSMNGLGCRSSDADLCLVLKGKVSVSDFTPRMSCKMYVCVCVGVVMDAHMILKHLFLFQKRHDPIFVLSVLQKLFKSLCE